MKRFRLRFSIRTWAIFVTLVGAYFGALATTDSQGIDYNVADNHFFAPLCVVEA